MAADLRSCILSPPRHRRAASHCAMTMPLTGAEPGLGEPRPPCGRATWSSTHPCSNRQSLSADTQAKADTAACAHTTCPPSHTWTHTHTRTCAHLLMKLSSGHTSRPRHMFTAMATHAVNSICLYHFVTHSHTTVLSTQSCPYTVIHVSHTWT